MEHVEVQGGEVSSTFADLALSDVMQKTVAGLGFTQPTPIQEKAIPFALEGRDIVGLAQTGTGKTAAFAIPMIERISSIESKFVKALILAPTRELADQIHSTIRDLTKGTSLRSTVIFGGVSHQRQLDELRRRPDIVVACPGRLLDHIHGRSIDLTHVEVLVVDEADRMCDMGFLPDVKKIARLTPKERQTLLFSATMPDEVEGVARELLSNPETVQVAYEKPVALITHGMFRIDEKEKGPFLVEWISSLPESHIVVFTQMKHVAKKVADMLIKSGVRATSLQGNLSQGKRKEAIDGFRKGRYQVLVATDIASRGIDVEGVTHVVNYDMPMTLDSYIHRSGRAGRASRSGEAVSLITRRDRGILKAVERYLGVPLQLLGGENPEAAVTVTRERIEQEGAEPRRERRNSDRGERASRPRQDRRDRPRRDAASGERSSGERFGSRGGDRPQRGRRFDSDRPGRDWDQVRKPRAPRSENGEERRSFRGPRSEERGGGRSEERRFEKREGGNFRRSNDRNSTERRSWKRDDDAPKRRDFGGERSDRQRRPEGERGERSERSGRFGGDRARSPRGQGRGSGYGQGHSQGYGRDRGGVGERRADDRRSDDNRRDDRRSSSRGPTGQRRQNGGNRRGDSGRSQPWKRDGAERKVRRENRDDSSR